MAHVLRSHADWFARDPEALTRALDELRRRGVTEVALDMSAVPWLSGPGFGAIADGWVKLRAAGGDLRAFAPQERVARTLSLAPQVLSFETEREALASFRE